MRDFGDTGQTDDPRRTFERVRLAQQAQRLDRRRRRLLFKAEDIAAEIGNDLARFDLEILVEIFVGHKSLSSRLCSAEAVAPVCATIASAIELTFSSHRLRRAGADRVGRVRRRTGTQPG